MPANEQVVLVHGLWMHGALMRWMARRIARAGYTVHRYTYPSVRMSLAENARRLAAFCQTLGARRVHLPMAQPPTIESQDAARLDNIAAEAPFQLGKVTVSAAHLQGGCAMGRTAGRLGAPPGGDAAHLSSQTSCMRA